MKKIVGLFLTLVLCVALPVHAAALAPGFERSVQTSDTLDLGIWFTIMGAALLLLVVVIALFHKFGKDK